MVRLVRVSLLVGGGVVVLLQAAQAAVDTEAERRLCDPQHPTGLAVREAVEMHQQRFELLRGDQARELLEGGFVFGRQAASVASAESSHTPRCCGYSTCRLPSPTSNICCSVYSTTSRLAASAIVSS